MMKRFLAPDEKVLGPCNKIDRRTIAGKRRLMARQKATSVMVDLLKTALAAGHKAKYVLFDSWFSNPQQLLDIKKLGLNTIAMVFTRYMLLAVSKRDNEDDRTLGELFYIMISEETPGPFQVSPVRNCKSWPGQEWRKWHRCPYRLCPQP